MDTGHAWSRRDFLQTLSSGVPTLALIARQTKAAAAGREGSEKAPASEKFTPIDLSHYFNLSPAEFGERDQAKELSGESARDGLVHTPAGSQNFRGIPFLLGAGGAREKSWLLLRSNPKQPSTESLDIPVGRRASFICLAAFCDWDGSETPTIGAGPDAMEKVGQLLAEAILVYEDGSGHVLPIRRRFEVNEPSVPWGHLSFASEPHVQDGPRELTDPLARGTEWGALQPGAFDNHYPSGPDGRSLGIVWICALKNPEPERHLKSLRFRSRSTDPLIICGLTLFHGQESPLRLERLTLYRLSLPEASGEDRERWRVSVDLGVVARIQVLEDFDPEAWLSAPSKGLGESAPASRPVRNLFVEVAASPDATLSLYDSRTGQRYDFELRRAVPGHEMEGKPAGARIEILEGEKVWLHGETVDAATQRPVPVRLAFRSKEGRYIPPYGHRTEINDAWFQDYGADLKLMNTSFAYVDGTFQAELPVGELYVEMTKGFEYEAVRRKLKIERGQRELKLEIARFADLRSQGWVTADTHVHFLSPTTAILEGQAEGLNLINLLAAQWRDLFTNVGDLSQGPLTSRDGETMVWVGTENRQHILGHLALLGSHGDAVFPMSASGPEESYLGDPLWTSLSEWADACRKREGLVVGAHFPYPTGETAADIVLGKIDALELYPRADYFNSLPYLDWYRYLNCGFRLPAVGGTDKMGAYMPAGANRTYAFLGQDQFSFDNWAKAVRRGNTFVTSGPLLFFHVEGHPPGSEITLPVGGGTLEVHAEAKSFVPIHRMDIVLNGKTVASREHPEGVREMILKEKVAVKGPAWLAARCGSLTDRTTRWNFRISAHTSPVYLGVPGQELFSASAVSYMLTLIDGAQSWVESLAIRPDPERLEHVRKLFEHARAKLHSRLHQHGIEH